MMDTKAITKKISELRSSLDELESLVEGEELDDEDVEEDDSEEEEPLKKNATDMKGKKKVNLMMAFIGKKK